MGSTAVIPVDVRVIAATNVDINRQIAEGSFRSDLLYRLNALEIYIPPLRERPDDILPLMENQLRVLSAEQGQIPPMLTAEAQSILRSYAWPGNVRELRNICERLVVLSRSHIVDGEALREILVFCKEAAAPAASAPAAPPLPGHDGRAVTLQVPMKKKDLAKELGVSRTTLWRMTKRQEAANRRPGEGEK